MTSNMTDPDLYQRTKELLEPGEIELQGIIVETDLTTEDEPALHQATIDIGEIISTANGINPAESYIYSGNDDSRFGVNQHQGLTLDADRFIWECQQLLRDGAFTIVFYYEASANQYEIESAVTKLGFEVTSVTTDSP